MDNAYLTKTITVRQKMATGDGSYIVCGNSNYTIKWDLDSEWDGYNEKTMLVVLDSGEAYSIQFTGTEAALPALPNTRRCVIGLMAGDVRTTTGAMFLCRPSIRDASGVPVEPPADVYAQLTAQLAGKISEPSQDGTAGQALITDGKGGRSWATVQGGGSADAILYTEQELTDEQQAQARANIMAGVRLFYGSDEVIAEGVAFDYDLGGRIKSCAFKDVVVFPATRVPNADARTEGNGSYEIVKDSKNISLTLSESADGTGLEASVSGISGMTTSAETVDCTKLFPGCWKATIKVIVTGGGKYYSEDYIFGAQLFAAGGASIPFPLLPERMVYAGSSNESSVPENARQLRMTTERFGYVDSEITIARSDSELREAMLNRSRVVVLNYSDKKADFLFTNDVREPGGSYIITSGIAIKDGKIGTFEIAVNSNSASYLSINVNTPESGTAPLVVTITEAETMTDGDPTYTSDHTFAEIQAAIQAGQNVYAMLSETAFSLRYINSGVVVFGDNSHEYAQFMTIAINSDSNTFVSNGYINELPEPVKGDLGKYLKVVGSDDDGYWWEPADAPQGPKGDTGDTGPQGPAGKDGAGMDVTGATIGQIAKISAVDDNGVPTAWEPVDMPSGGGGGSFSNDLLAEGTIASGAAPLTNSQTGLTIGDLRNYKSFIIIVTGTISGRLYYNFGANIGTVKNAGRFTWEDDQKTILRCDGYSQYTDVFSNNYAGNIEYWGTYYPWIRFDFRNVPDSKPIVFTNSAETTTEVAYKIMGWIK